MNKSQVAKEMLWQEQGIGLRDPLGIYGSTAELANWTEKSLRFKTKEKFITILEKLNVTLLVSREYEHLVLGIHAKEGKIKQSFVSLPHPSGIAVSDDEQRVYIASTRNPNFIMEMGIVDQHMDRLEDKKKNLASKVLMPLRTKYFPGAYYFHDLALIDGALYANSVGQNGVVKIDMNNSGIDTLFWQVNPKKSDTKKLNTANYLQLNSIAAGKTFEDSFFSASAAKVGKYRPGDKHFPVDGKGVIFNAESEVVGKGLTRPHSARMHKGEIWVNNSGYGEVGIIKDGKFNCIAKLPGWTRGLCFVGDYAFVGFSVVLKKFEHYAPGIDYDKASCGIAIINTKTGKIEGEIEFPYGNQIFQVESISKEKCEGFQYSGMQTDTQKHISQHYRYIINRK